MMVLRASKKDLELGGHMASYQSSATLYEVCLTTSSVLIMTMMAVT